MTTSYIILLVTTQTGTLEGKRLGKYVLQRLLGRGGTGDVYLGVTPNGNRVAIKLLDHVIAKSPEMVERFRREATAVRSLSHPNVVEVLDVGTFRGRYFIAMELLRAGAFRRLVKDGNKPRAIIYLLSQVAQAIAYAHENGVVHRDLKPENVLLTRSGKAKVVDFGLARINDATTLTVDGAMLGTAYYMSPEQAQGKRADAPSDVYSLGVMIYEAISGKLPFSSDTPYGFIYQHANETPQPPRLRRGFSPGLARLCMACLAKDPGRRPSMTDVDARLREAQSWRPYWTPKRLLVAAAAALVLVSGVLFVRPSTLDPLCGKWFAGGAFRSLRGGMTRAHDAVFGPAKADRKAVPERPHTKSSSPKN